MVTIEEALSVAVQHHQSGRLAEAEAIYRQVLDIQPDNADALHLVGLVRRRQGRHEEALALIERAVALRPGAGPYHANLGNLLVDMGRHGDAVEHFRKALTAFPGDATVAGRLAFSLWVCGRYDEAEAAYRVAIALKPDEAEHHFNLGVTFQRQNRQSDAELAFRDCLGIDPFHKAAWNSLGTVLRRQGRLDEGVIAHQRSLAIDPEYWEGHKCLGLTLLIKGDYADGFRHYEERRKTDEGRTIDLPRPEWDGSPLGDRTLLVTAEQGLGDSLNFIRYVPILKARHSGTVMFGCPRPLVTLLTGMPGIDRLVPFGDAVPPFDLHVPLLSLPLLLGTTLDTIPPPEPRLRASPGLEARWAERLGPRDGRLRVGIVWSGNPEFPNNRFRSPGLDAYIRLFDVPGVQFYALQKGGGRDALTGRAMPANFTDLGPEIDDFSDTAAIVASLDLVITMCTSVAHLLGAMVHPVWVVLSAVPDWRWLLDRSDSPWYPSARLFRQREIGDWSQVMTEVEAALRVLAAAPR